MTSARRLLFFIALMSPGAGGCAFEGPVRIRGTVTAANVAGYSLDRGPRSGATPISGAKVWTAGSEAPSLAECRTWEPVESESIAVTDRQGGFETGGMLTNQVEALSVCVEALGYAPLFTPPLQPSDLHAPDDFAPADVNADRAGPSNDLYVNIKLAPESTATTP